MDIDLEESIPKIDIPPLEKKHTPAYLDQGALEEVWFTEYAGREPQQTPKITSAEQFDQLQVGILDHFYMMEYEERKY